MNRKDSGWLGGLLGGLAIAAAAHGAWAETRMALVIGNGDYAHGGKLANPVNDALSISQTLTKIGFTVVTKTNLGRDGMVDALKTFARDSAASDVALIYYAGHGMEIGGTNYLLPIDVTLSADTDVEFEAVPVDRALTAVSGAHRLKVVILDACRNNPYLDVMKRANAQRDISVGLARPVPPTGMVIAYAAREGSTSADGTGADSPYATALAKHLQEPGVDIRILFGEVHDDVLKATGGRQEPSDYDSIGGQGFYLIAPTDSVSGKSAAGESARTLAVITQTPATPDARQLEMAFWEKVDAKDPAQLRAYLDQYPTGTYASLARAKLALAGTAQAAPAAPSPAEVQRATAAEAASSGADAYRAKDLAGALSDWRQAASLGNSGGQFRLGLLYAKGEGVTVDYTEAMKWYQLSAAQGNAKAMNNIGNLHNYGRGVPQDYAEALRWYRMAADKGSANGEFNLGLLYIFGRGVIRDPAQARAWFAKAAAQGDPDVRDWMTGHPLLARLVGPMTPS